MESITIRLEKGISDKMREYMHPYYSTKTEFIREAIRDKLKTIEKERIVSEIKKLKGSAKNKKIRKLSVSDYDNMLKNIKNGKTSEKLRKHNLKRKRLMETI
jgi:Arc/MetJ-type ribon-helix-helix transcriptional regulator